MFHIVYHASKNIFVISFIYLLVVFIIFFFPFFFFVHLKGHENTVSLNNEKLNRARFSVMHDKRVWRVEGGSG